MRVGLVGYGYWAPKIARCLHRLGSLAAIAELLPERQAAAHADHPYARVYPSFERLLDDPEIDAVAIATPILTHADLVERALRAGKHAFVEKPLCTKPEMAAALVQMARERSLLLHVGHTYVYHPALLHLRDLIEFGEFGPIHHVSAAWENLGIIQTDLSVLWSVGPHPVSIMAWLLGGPPSSVCATGAAYLGQVEDVVALSLRWAGGQFGSALLSWLSPRKTRRLTIVGKQRMAIFDEQAEDVLRVYDVLGDERRPQLDYAVQASSPPGEPLMAELRAFCDLDGHVPNAGQPAVDVVRVLAAAERSIRSDGQRMEVYHSSETVSGPTSGDGLYLWPVQSGGAASG